MLYRVVTLAGLLALAFVSNTARAADPAARPVPAYDELAIAHRFFYVGAEASYHVVPYLARQRTDPAG